MKNFAVILAAVLSATAAQAADSWQVKDVCGEVSFADGTPILEGAMIPVSVTDPNYRKPVPPVQLLASGARQLQSQIEERAFQISQRGELVCVNGIFNQAHLTITVKSLQDVYGKKQN